ncbi:MAG: hypothetical protein GXO09_05855 [Crenarchaeota archaeon]|nr:hypothetical protein [Thermoproteota archaeon]
MGHGRVRVLRGRGCRECIVVAETIEEFLCTAARSGLDVPDEVVVEAFETHSLLEPRLEAEARSIGAAYGGVRPESCVLYAGWTGLPQVYVVLSACRGLDEKCIRGEAARAAAHSILHRGIDCYVYTINYYYESTLRIILGPLYPAFLYLVGAGVRGYEANSLAVRLGYGDLVAVDEVRALAGAVAALAALKPARRPRLLIAAELFKYLAESRPLARPGSPVLDMLGRLAPLYPAEYNAALRALAAMEPASSTAERARLAAEKIIEELLA